MKAMGILLVSKVVMSRLRAWVGIYIVVNLIHFLKNLLEIIRFKYMIVIKSEKEHGSEIIIIF